MRVLLITVLFIASGLIVLLLVPTKQPLKPVENQSKLQVESAKNDIRDVTPDNALPGPDVSGKLLNRLPDKKNPIQETVKPQRQKYQNLIVTSAGILNTKDLTLQIRDIKPLKLEAICQTQSAQSWPCGRFARTAMRQLILKHTIQCEPTDTNITPIFVKCQIGSRDIGKWLVLRGWAKSAGQTYANEMAVAKERHHGMWRKTLP
jgi:endonuclease YncB( thermonuclease family)